MPNRKRLWCPARLVALLIFAAALVPAHAQDQPTFRSETHLIDFTFSVRKADGTLVKSLTRDDFQITEDGVPQKIAFFGKETDLPLTLGLIVDASDSQSKFIKRHYKDIEKFLKTVMGPNDQAFTLCFGNHLRLTNDSSSSVGDIMDGLNRFDHGDRNFPELAPDDKREGGTALYDAIYYGVRQKLSQAQGRRRALILFTDGEENSSAHDLLEAIGIAQDSDTLIYAIRYTESEKHGLTAHSRQGIAALHHLSAETGGTDFDALHVDMPKAFEQISEELRSLYSIAYHSTHHKRDGTFHKVVISTEESSYNVRARTGYYAR
ncbi:VWA domain-containing protein [Occallatibacter riparius]|uniref:VWA domain-containing protein n=1 Tax=Occallatibacter riparius TaxID=1002689 RepID=A0A9J7BQ44_9BACT|nr:VWA domain-containing protein [Occallatibacter riparius]UWZ83062.1 VWA domain-containing protein [Occallatibacter riparius]